MTTNFPKPLLKALEAKECVLFCGSGLSRWSGLPDWEGLLVRMLDYLSERGLPAHEKTEVEAIIRQGDLLMAASLCAQRMCSADKRAFFDDVFIDPNPRPHEMHNLIVGLGPDSYVTTNYDHLVDDAYQPIHGGLVLMPVNNDQPVEHARIMKHGASRFIFAPHCRAEKIDTVVLSREDYRKVQFEIPSVGKTLEHLFLSRPVVYLGFGLRDPDFFMLRDQIASTYQGGAREHFAIFPDVSDMMKRFWRDTYGINVFSYQTNEVDVPDGRGGTRKQRCHDELIRILRDLHSALNGEAPPSAGTPLSPSPTGPPPPPVSNREKSTRRRASYITQAKSALIRFCEDVEYQVTKETTRHFKLNASFRPDLSPELSININDRKQPALDVLSAFSNIVIVGAPGAGKSYLVRMYSAHIARRALLKIRKSKKPLQGVLKHAIPLLLPMREYTGSLKAMIAERIPRSVALEKLLASGVLTIICDAVNEVSRDLVETKVLADDLSNFTTKFPLCRYVVTTRLLAYLPTLPFPVFEIEPLRQADLSDCLMQSGISSDNLSIQLRRTLDNPLLLTLYLELAAKDRRDISNPSNLLAGTIEIMGKKLLSLRKTQVDLRTLVSPAAFDLVGRGRLSMTLEETEAHLASALTQSKRNEERVDVNALISIGLLTVDAEGQIGFFHQTALEYLAAVELLRRYGKDSGELKNLINFHRWDETIALFVSLLDQDTQTKVLTELSLVDIGFACHTFESATIKQKETALFLFDLIVKKLEFPRLPDSEKQDLSRAAKKLAPYGRRDVLVKWLDDAAMAHDAALHLAMKKDKAIIPRLVDLLIKDNVWPSDFARALDLLADETIVHILIRRGEKNSSDSLADSNIADVLWRFESEALYQETDRLCRSPEANKRAFAAEILSRMKSLRANETLAHLLSDKSHDVQWRALFALSGGWRREGYKTADIVAKVFKLLSKRAIGHDAASYLIEHADSEILDEAQRRLPRTRSETEQINLCAILAKKNPDTVRSLLFEKLRNYRPYYHAPLYHALANLPVNSVLPEVLTFLRIDNPKLRNTVLEALGWLGIHSEELPISKEDCSFLFSLWEKQPQLYHGASFLLADKFRTMSKPLFVERLNNPTDTDRSLLVEWVSRMPLTKADLKPEAIEWLIANLDTKSQYGGWSPVAKIVGQVLDESAVHEKLIPLLSSSNPTVRSNAYTAVKTAERTLGKRLLKVSVDQEQSSGE